MEGSESEKVFNSLNLNPQLFMNQAINTVDDLVDDAFNHFHQEASTSLKIEGTDRAPDLSKGVNIIRKMVQSNLHKQLSRWEEYCLVHCFHVPEGFMLPENDESPVDASICQNTISDPDLDAQLDLLRNKLAEAGKESATLDQEFQSLERQSASSHHVSALVNETLQLSDLKSYHEMFQEMVETASELRMNIGKLKTRKMEEAKCNKADRIYNPLKDSSITADSKGFSNSKLEDLQAFSAIMKNM